MTIHKKYSIELHLNQHLNHYATKWQENTVTWQPINTSYENETPGTWHNKSMGKIWIKSYRVAIMAGQEK